MAHLCGMQREWDVNVYEMCVSPTAKWAGSILETLLSKQWSSKHSPKQNEFHRAIIGELQGQDSVQERKGGRQKEGDLGELPEEPEWEYCRSRGKKPWVMICAGPPWLVTWEVCNSDPKDTHLCCRRSQPCRLQDPGGSFGGNHPTKRYLVTDVETDLLPSREAGPDLAEESSTHAIFNGEGWGQCSSTWSSLVTQHLHIHLANVSLYWQTLSKLQFDGNEEMNSQNDQGGPSSAHPSTTTITIVTFWKKKKLNLKLQIYIT